MVKNLLAMRETWAGKIPWRRERLPTPVFWPGEFHGLYSPRCGQKSDITEQLSLSFFICFTCGNGYVSMLLLIFHPLLPVLCPYICPLCLRLYCYTTNRFIRTIFLDSLYIHSCTIFVFLTYTSLCIIGSGFIHLSRTNPNLFLFMANIPLYIYIYIYISLSQLLYPFISQ